MIEEIIFMNQNPYNFVSYLYYFLDGYLMGNKKEANILNFYLVLPIIFDEVLNSKLKNIKSNSSLITLFINATKNKKKIKERICFLSENTKKYKKLTSEVLMLCFELEYFTLKDDLNIIRKKECDIKIDDEEKKKLKNLGKIFSKYEYEKLYGDLGVIF